MSSFLTLFRYEMRLLFPRKERGVRRDIVGGLLSLLLTLVIAAAFGLLLFAVADNYVAVTVNKVADPTARTLELLNVAYLGLLVALALVGVEKMRSTLTRVQGKAVFLRLPVKQQTIFLSKLSALALYHLFVSVLLLLPVNAIVWYILRPTPDFFWRTALVVLLLSLISFFVSALLLIPYIKIVDFLSSRYLLLFLFFSALLIGAFFVYSELLTVVQSLLETGNIKFLFNEQFILTLQTLLVYAYPANLLAKVTMGVDLPSSLLVLGAVTVLSLVVILLVTRGLYAVTLYKNESRGGRGKKKTAYRERRVLSSFMKKEFISIFRNPNHLFSYFAVAAAMPVMVYCCYTLFTSLLQNTLGISASFALSLLVTLIFSILTNTFCSTNITRDGIALLKTKVLPVRPSTILLSKVLLCAGVSSGAVLLSDALLVSIAGLSPTDALWCFGICFVFSLSQIFLATRMDLNHTRLSMNPYETERVSSSTVAKVTGLGFVLALLMGIGSVALSVFSSELESALSFHVPPIAVYLLPLAVSVVYLFFSIVYYSVRIDKRYENIVL